MLVVCVEAGLGLTAAIQRVGEELQFSHPDLGAEFALVTAEMRAGVEREAALQGAGGADRARGHPRPGEPARADPAFGTSIADTLRVYAEEFRDKRMQRAEELAAKIGTKLIFPLVLLPVPIVLRRRNRARRHTLRRGLPGSSGTVSARERTERERQGRPDLHIADGCLVRRQAVASSLIVLLARLRHVSRPTTRPRPQRRRATRSLPASSTPVSQRSCTRRNSQWPRPPRGFSAVMRRGSRASSTWPSTCTCSRWDTTRRLPSPS